MSSARTGADSAPGESPTAFESNQSADSTPHATGGGADLGQALRGLLDEAARTLGVPLALLSRDRGGWRFEAEAFPQRPVADSARFRAPDSDWLPAAGAELTDQRGSPWTGLFAGYLREREWLLMLPGTAERWKAVAGLEPLTARFGQNLESVVRLDDERHLAALHRRLYAFVRRLTRTPDVARTHRCILETIAREVSAQTAAFATYVESEKALAITATLGYPSSLVEHVRIQPGQGVLGEAFLAARPAIVQVEDTTRLRYRTNSYMVLPLVVSGQCLAVIALTDRADGQAFESRDLASARLLTAPAALALARHRVSESLVELTRAATVDPVTGLFNRRYFETQLQAEVQRARRQGQELALLMVDIDDFKRINDTLGHLEGDRALRNVANLLRRGVRIFDLCARYGGEEFAIVMPGATREVAVQVAERIRVAMHDRSSLTPLPMTVSIGVGFLGLDETEEDLIGAADRALMAAKRAGKNVVKTA
jgi:diguanylate cyclase (GGDEF)-like protein